MDTIVIIFAIIKDIIMTIAAGVGAYVAIKGLKTWRNQIKGKSENELSQNILLTLYKFRNAINYVRNPVIFTSNGKSFFSHEVLFSNQNNKAKDYAESHFQDISAEYKARLDKVDELANQLNLYLLESKIMWGDELKTLFKDIYQLKFELDMAIHFFLESMNPTLSFDFRENHIENSKNNLDTIVRSLARDKDNFGERLDEAISQIEKFLKPKLI